MGSDESTGTWWTPLLTFMIPRGSILLGLTDFSSSSSNRLTLVAHSEMSKQLLITMKFGACIP